MANDSIDQAMVRSIIQIAQTIGKRTIAEYVHDARSLEILCELGVDYAQGFYVGRPSRTPVSPLSNGSSE
jgi:EAL domain-containing protein (putative c-di-GMP-specific phosphodiesterase class I)